MYWDTNGEIWELNSHDCLFSMPNKTATPNELFWLVSVPETARSCKIVIDSKLTIMIEMSLLQFWTLTQTFVEILCLKLILDPLTIIATLHHVIII